MPIIPTGEENIIWSGDILELVSFQVRIGEKIKTYEKARRPPGVRAILVRADGYILLSREYRREAGRYDYRLPGGKIWDTLVDWKAYTGDVHTAAADACIRECQEEAGVEVHNPELLRISPCGSNVDWDLYYYVCTDIVDTGEHARDDEWEADMSTAWYTPDTVIQKILAGDMSEDRSIWVLLPYILSRKTA